MISGLYRSILIPSYETGLKRRRTFRYWSKLEQSQWQCSEELRDGQVLALRRLVQHAAIKCPFYAASWSALDLTPERIDRLEDFERFPVIDRETVQRYRTEMCVSTRDEKLIKKATGGSSGVPLQFYLNQDSNDRRMAAWHRGYGWAGAEPGIRQVYLWGVPLGDRTWLARSKDYLYEQWLYRRQVLNTFDLNDATMPEYLHRYNRYRPDCTCGLHKSPLFVRTLARRTKARTLFASVHCCVCGETAPIPTRVDRTRVSCTGL